MTTRGCGLRRSRGRAARHRFLAPPTCTAKVRSQSSSSVSARPVSAWMVPAFDNRVEPAESLRRGGDCRLDLAAVCDVTYPRGDVEPRPGHFVHRRFQGGGVHVERGDPGAEPGQVAQCSRPMPCATPVTSTPGSWQPTSRQHAGSGGHASPVSASSTRCWKWAVTWSHCGSRKFRSVAGEWRPPAACAGSAGPGR